VRRAPRGLWPPVLVAILASWAWSISTPWFQVPDEVVHVGYVHYLGETGRVPRRINTALGYFDPSPELARAVSGVPFSYQGVPFWERRSSEGAHERTSERLDRKHEAEAGTAANNPPLYYLVEAVPYVATKSANIFDRILAMRLFSSLLAGLTVAFTFLFLRELLPGAPWSWTVGALGVALNPLLGFVSGGVNPDALLWAACAALFWLIARTFRHGLTLRRGIGIGAVLAAGILTKGAMYGLVPGALLALGIGVWRAERPARRGAALAAGAGVAAAALPLLAWAGVSALLNQGGPTALTGGVRQGVTMSLRDGLSYVWQVYLPKLPFMNEQFDLGTYPLWDYYFQGFVGRFGYFNFGFQDRVNYLGLALFVGVVVLAGRALWLGRDRVRARLPEVVCYVALVLALLALLGAAGYQFERRIGLPFEQTRYLFLLLPLYGALLAVAARGAGRLGRYVGVGLVAIAAAHELFAVLLTISHYYT
jgi:4-amino-4-deoxy-L-arabinose transferase-like glycosyltransferase